MSRQNSFRFDRPRSRNSYDADNLRCARLILRDRTRWQTECVFLVRWAELVMRRLEAKNAA